MAERRDPDEVDHLLSRLTPRQAVELLLAERDRAEAEVEQLRDQNHRLRERVIELDEACTAFNAEANTLRAALREAREALDG